jgi:hypothetical protein
MEPMEGIFDNMILNLLKDALDVSKIDKPKLKSAVSLAADACKPATKLPADLDDKGWDMLKDAANVLIDKIGVQAPITVGAAPEVGRRTRKDVEDAIRAEGGDPATFAPWLLLLLQFAPMMVELIRKLLGK